MSSLIVAVLVALAPGRAWAPCHLIDFVEVFAGTTDCPRAQYVVLELQADFENFVNGTSVSISTGEMFGTFTADVPNAMLGDKVLMATAEAEALFGITADHTAPGLVLIESPDGFVRYSCSGDEVHYGAVPMSESPPLAPDFAITRIGGVWMSGPPAPVNNAGQTGVLGTCPASDGGIGSDGPPTDLAMADGPAPTDGPPADGPATADGPMLADGPAPIDAAFADAPVTPDGPGAADVSADGPRDASDGEVDASRADAPHDAALVDGPSPDAPDAAQTLADAAAGPGAEPLIESPQGCDCRVAGRGRLSAAVAILLLLPLASRRRRRHRR